MDKEIYYLSPYHAVDDTANLDIGGTYNRQIASLPDNAWIAITDHDAMFLRHDAKKTIHNILQKTNYGLYGCLTNRVGDQYQRASGMFEVDSLHTHLQKANALYEWYGEDVILTQHPIAGFFMLFSKKTWEEVGGFVPKSIQFDYLFSEAVKRSGKQLAIMPGVYMLHLYRYGSEQPRLAIEHLISK